MINSVQDREDPGQGELDVGAIVGENVLVVTFEVVDASVALSIIFAA